MYNLGTYLYDRFFHSEPKAIPLPLMDGKVSLSHLHSNDRLLSDEEISTRLEEHRHQIYPKKIKKIDPTDFSTVYAKGSNEKMKIFALYRGKKGFGCGSGAFGKVKLAQDLQSGEWCAVKIIRSATHYSSNWVTACASNERNVLGKLGLHKGSVQIYDGKFNQNITYIFMEYVHGSVPIGSDMNLESFFKFIKESLESLTSLHEKGFLHRDIKLDNMIHHPDPSYPSQLIDYGSALPMDSTGQVIVEDEDGMNFIHPEWRNQEGEICLNQYTDMYCLGRAINLVFMDLPCYRDHKLPVELSTKIDNFIEIIAPYEGMPYSQYTAREALEVFQKIAKMYTHRE